MTDVFVVYNNEEQLNRIGDTSKYTLIFHFIDAMAKKGKKEAYRLKSHYAARLDPFAVILDKNKPIKAFYSEAEDVIDSLIKYLNNNESKSN